MSYCCVKLCNNNTRTSNVKKDGITFHRFPKYPEIKLQWINATYRGDKWSPSTSSVICSKHFTEDSFHYMKGRRRVMDAALPTLHLTDLGDCLDSKESDSKTDNFMTKQDVARIMDNTAKVVKEKVGEKNKIIHRLQNNNARLKKRVNHLQDVVKNEGIKREKPESTMKLITRKLIARCALKDRTIYYLQTACAKLRKKMEGAVQVKNTAGPATLTKKEDQENEKSHEGSATPSEDSEVEIQRLAKKLTAALTTISVLTKKNGDLTKKNQELSKKVAALEQKNKLMGRQQAVLQKLNEGLARRSLLVEQRSERLRARIAAHGITDAVTDDDEGEEEEPRPPPDTHPHPESDTEETETADEDWAMSQDSSPEQTGTTSKIRPKPLNDLLRVSHQKNVKIVNVLAKSKRRMPRKATNTTLGKRSRHNSVTSKNSRIETCVEPLVETSCVGSEQADPLSLMTPDEIKIEDDIKIEEPDIEEYIAATKQI